MPSRRTLPPLHARLPAGTLATTLASSALHAQAGTYTLNAANPANATSVTLLAGAWTFGVSAGAWSPWNYVSECDALGNNCHTGFHTVFYYTLNGGPQQKHGWDGGERERYTPERFSDFYDTPERAFLHAFDPLSLTVNATTTLTLYIPDCCFWDNTGGLDIEVRQAETPVSVPEPTGLAMLLAALAGLGFRALSLARDD